MSGMPMLHDTEAVHKSCMFIGAKVFAELTIDPQESGSAIEALKDAFDLHHHSV